MGRMGRVGGEGEGEGKGKARMKREIGELGVETETNFKWMFLQLRSNIAVDKSRTNRSKFSYKVSFSEGKVNYRLHNSIKI